MLLLPQALCAWTRIEYEQPATRSRRRKDVSEIVAISDGQIAVVQRAVLVNVDHVKVRQNRDFVENPMRRAAVE